MGSVRSPKDGFHQLFIPSRCVWVLELRCRLDDGVSPWCERLSIPVSWEPGVLTDFYRRAIAHSVDDYSLVEYLNTLQNASPCIGHPIFCFRMKYVHIWVLPRPGCRTVSSPAHG